MEFKNIHNRKEFLKVYEFLGGTQGGAGSSDGFANSAKMKDTMLGKLFNGIFKGIGWLWRKSKENFIINKLIAQLINELMRGTILFCLDNDIDLKTGSIPSGTTIKQNDDNEIIDVISGTTTSGTTTSGTTTSGTTVSERVRLKIEEINKITSLDELKKVKDEVTADKIQIGKNIRQKNSNIQILIRRRDAATNQADKKKIQDQIDKLKKELDESKVEINDSNLILMAIEKREKELSQGPPKIDFSKLEKACKDKYQFIATADDPGAEAISFGAMAYPVFLKSFQQRYKTKFIKIGDKFTIIREGKLQSIEIYDVDTVKGAVSYKFNNNLEVISTTKLLPNGFPSFRVQKDLAEAFLKNHVNEYDTMSDDEKKRIEIVYMNYAIINAMREVQRSAIAESLHYSQYLAEAITSTVKTTPDEPRAGQVGPVRTAELAISSPTVGDILTIRDKKKFEQEKGEEFKLKVTDVNLAEIEKTIQKLDEGAPVGSDEETLNKYKVSKEKYGDTNVRTKVATYVNPYNLKMIQISFEKLMLPTKQGEGTNNREALRLRWNKEVNKVYAGFTNIMNISSVDITKDEFGGKLNNDKVNQKVEKNVSSVGFQKTIGETQEKLPIAQDESKLSSLGGSWSFYSFSYSNYNFMTSIAPVKSVSSDFYFFMVTKAFSAADATAFSVTNDDSFKQIFVGKTCDNVNVNAKQINVFFLMPKNTKFPTGSSSKQPNRILVFNDIIFTNGNRGLYLCKPKEKYQSISITDDLIKKDIKDYITSVTTNSCHKFVEPDVNNWTTSFNLSITPSEANYCDFDHHDPKFLDAKMRDYLKKLAEKM